MNRCDRCLQEKEHLETFSYRVVCADGSINIDQQYCTECCNEIEQEHQEDE